MSMKGKKEINESQEINKKNKDKTNINENKKLNNENFEKKKNVDEVKKIGFEEDNGKQNKSYKKKNNKDDENKEVQENNKNQNVLGEKQINDLNQNIKKNNENSENKQNIESIKNKESKKNNKNQNESQKKQNKINSKNKEVQENDVNLNKSHEKLGNDLKNKNKNEIIELNSQNNSGNKENQNFIIKTIKNIYTAFFNEKVNQIQEQTQTQVSKQKLKQLQDQKHSYNILGRIMSYAENYSYLNNPIKNYQKKYKYYDSFNASSEMSLEEYRDTFILQLIIFKSSFKNYEKKHGKYEFPEELSKEDLKAEINMLKSNLKNHKDDKLYDSILSIIEGKDVNLEEFQNELDEIDNDGYDGKCDPQTIMNYIPFVKNSVDDEDEKIEEKYLDDPNYRNKLKLNEEKPDFDYDKIPKNNEEEEESLC